MSYYKEKNFSLPWDELTEDDLKEFILKNMNYHEHILDKKIKKELISLADIIYKGQIKDNYDITNKVTELEKKHISNISQLPNDDMYLIALNIEEYKNLLNLCRTNKEMKKICNNKNFLINYISKNWNIDKSYLISFDSEQLKEIADILDNTITIFLWSKFSSKGYEDLSNFFHEKHIKETNLRNYYNSEESGSSSSESGSSFEESESSSEEPEIKIYFPPEEHYDEFNEIKLQKYEQDIKNYNLTIGALSKPKSSDYIYDEDRDLIKKKHDISFLLERKRYNRNPEKWIEEYLEFLNVIKSNWYKISFKKYQKYLDSIRILDSDKVYFYPLKPHIPRKPRNILYNKLREKYKREGIYLGDLNEDVRYKYLHLSDKEKEKYEKISKKEEKKYEKDMVKFDEDLEKYKNTMEKIESPKLLSSFDIFFEENKENLKKEMDNYGILYQSLEDYSNIKWKKLSDEKREKYYVKKYTLRNKYEEELEIYEEELEIYNIYPEGWIIDRLEKLNKNINYINLFLFPKYSTKRKKIDENINYINIFLFPKYSTKRKHI